MGDYSWVIGAILGGGVLLAFALMLLDWRRDTFKQDVLNAAAGVAAWTGGLFALNALHARHMDWMLGPLAAMILILFGRESIAGKLLTAGCMAIFFLGGFMLQDIVSAYHVQRYQLPIDVAALAVWMGVCLVIARTLKPAQRGVASK